MPEDAWPELATNEEWCAIMIRERRRRGLTQEELAVKVGTSQVMISKIESYTTKASTFIKPISIELDIPIPQHFENDEARAWSQLGHLLRTRRPDQFKSALSLVESMVKGIDPEPLTDDQQPAAPKK